MASYSPLYDFPPYTSAIEKYHVASNHRTLNHIQAKMQ